MQLFIQVQHFIICLCMFCGLFIQPVFFLPIFLYKCIVVFLSRRNPKLGKVLTPKDSCLANEDFTRFPPKVSVVSTMLLDGDLSLQEFQSAFVQHVINACIPSSSSSKLAYFREQSTGYCQTRYPELMQYQSDFMGHKFWKDDADFSLSNHIRAIDHSKNPNLDLIHEEMLNKPFNIKRSPWEIVLIRNYYNMSEEIEDTLKSQLQTLVVARFHHSMVDAKSILKLFVECLGQQSLTISKPQEMNKSLYGNIFSTLIFPMIYLCQNVKLFMIVCFGSGLHPWRTPIMGGDNNKLLIRFSQNMPLKEIKDVAKRNNISTSAVLISMITGAIYNLDSELRTKTVLAGYILPLENHPPTLCNHFTGSIIQLPTNKHLSTKERLQLCHNLFRDIKSSSMKEFLESAVLQIGTLFDPLRKLIARNVYATIGITNIAGESKEFSIVQRKCSEFTFSVGTLGGCSGVSFSCSSYQDNFRVAVIANESVLDEAKVQKLANAFGEELQVMKK
ncbi:unnamed protein product [Orchesella dallaii]|uniref:O-acyltransferase WSD1 C-terminal domain-containing protein n=1 Tax=Orchesella dallaii TaxID=48710 RepID=A0ABP1Q5V6_9HEXA